MLLDDIIRLISIFMTSSRRIHLFLHLFVSVLYFNSAKFSIKLFSFIYIYIYTVYIYIYIYIYTVSVVSQQDKYEIVTETQLIKNT